MSSGLQVEGVSAGYGRTEVLHDIHLHVPQGATVALLGANGAGKSTLLKVISSLIPVTSGSIFWGETRLDGRSPVDVVRQQIAHVPEGRRIFPRMTVYDNLRAANYGRPKKDLKVALESVLEAFPNLRPRLNTAGGLLSGGEQQMLAIGRAMVARPSLILIDELSLGLAPIIIGQIYSQLDSLFSRDVAILLVEQMATTALAHCDSVYVLRNGRIVAHGASSEFRSDKESLRNAYLGD